jgi:hypothetical protein
MKLAFLRKVLFWDDINKVLSVRYCYHFNYCFKSGRL